MENKTILQEILEDTSSKNILVSASAGTGKTYTMVQKAISLLINDDECSLDNILMLTFSREAAGNMRSKIEKEIRNILVEKGEQFKYLNDDQKNKLRTQLNKLPTAQISTLDSFCYTIIKKYFNAISIDPSIKIGDPAELDILLINEFDDLLNKKINEGNQVFLKLISRFRENGGYESFFKTIKNIIDFAKMQKMPYSSIEFKDKEKQEKFIDFLSNHGERENFFDTCLKQNTKEYKENLANKYLELLKEELSLLTTALDNMLNDVRGEDIVFKPSKKSFLELRNILKDALLVDDLSIFIHRLDGINEKDYSFTSYNSNAIKNIFKTGEEYTKYKIPKGKIDEFLKKIKPIKYSYEDYLKNDKEFEEIITIVEFAKELDIRYLNSKNSKGILDYTDSNILAIMALSNEDVRKDSVYKYVFVDEYQDTNYLNEILINLSSEYSKQLICVGDIKQSIYGFRNAQPQIFVDRMENIQSGKINGKIYNLDTNFRAKEDIVEFTNCLFRNIINKDTCGIDFIDSKFAEKNKDESKENRVKIFEYEPKKPDPTKLEGVYDIEKQPEKEESIDCLNLTINQIKYLHSKGIKYKNMAVLFRKNKELTEFIKLLRDEKVPFNIAKGNKLIFEEINTLINSLRIAINSDQDIPLYDCLTSVIGNITDKEMADIRKITKSKNGTRKSLWESINVYKDAKDNSLYSENVQTKLDSFFKFLEDIKEKSRYLPASILLSYILSTSKMDAYLLSNDYYEGANKIEQINQFIDYIGNVSADSDISDFLEYYDEIYDGISSISSEDSLTLMTQHGSKGLEFDYVFLPNLEAVSGDNKMQLVKDADFGIALKKSNVNENTEEDDYESFSFKTIKELYDITTTKEMIRVFYVATTRAKEELIMSYKKEKSDQYSLFDVINKGESTLIHWAANFIPDYCINPIIDRTINCTDINDNNVLQKLDIIKSVESTADGVSTTKEKKSTDIGDVNLFGDEDIFAGRKYIYEESTKEKGKFTVTEIVSENKEEDTSVVKTFNQGEPEYIAKGNALHLILEKIDLSIKNENVLLEEIENLRSQGIIDDLYDIYISEESHKILKVLSLETIKLAVENKYEREKEFIYYAPKEGLSSEDKVMIQGAIDLLIETPEGYIVVDYKASRASKETLKNRYKKQLDVYATAVENILNKKVIKCVVISLLTAEEVSWGRDGINFNIFENLKD